MSREDETKQYARRLGFTLAGIVSTRDVDEIPFPPGRGLRRPSEVWPEARSLLVLGIVVSDEAQNTSVSIPGGYYPGLSDGQYFNFYYEITESRAWRLAHLLSDEFGMRCRPTHRVALKPAAALAGLGHIGRSTLLVTPDWGPRVRLVGLLTEDELTPDAPFERDLCADEPRCREKPLCIDACPYRAIAPGDSHGVPPGRKVKLERCVVYHVNDREITKPWDRFIRRASERGFMECTLCNLACPYGEGIENKTIPAVPGAI
jgi:epoxyqueuosine reductase